MNQRTWWIIAAFFLVIALITGGWYIIRLTRAPAPVSTPKSPGVDPNLDSDGDGLTDVQERDTYRTDPLLKDTDTDGLYDNDELFIYKSSPINPDTDGDGFGDGAEVRAGYDPLTPARR